MKEMPGLHQTNKYFGASLRVRWTLLVLISFLVWTLEVFLLIMFRSVRAPMRVPISFWPLPLVHLLPWVAGMQWLRRVNRAVRRGIVNSNAANLCYSIILALLSVTYVGLCSFELAFGLAWRFADKIFFP